MGIVAQKGGDTRLLVSHGYLGVVVVVVARKRGGIILVTDEVRSRAWLFHGFEKRVKSAEERSLGLLMGFEQ